MLSGGDAGKPSKAVSLAAGSMAGVTAGAKEIRGARADVFVIMVPSLIQLFDTYA